jgi:hypothetical protein
MEQQVRAGHVPDLTADDLADGTVPPGENRRLKNDGRRTDRSRTEEVVMAELLVEGDQLVLRLSGPEKLEGVHGDLRAPLSSVRSVEILENAHEPADHGFKVGERLPGVSEVAVVHTGGQRLFAAVHHDTRRGVRVNFEGISYDAWIVGCADPESVKDQLDQR